MTGREYLPMAATVAFWAVVALAVGHADAARLLAATVLLRAVQMLVQMATIGPLKRRAGAPREVRRQARAMAIWLQLGSLASAIIVIAALAALLAAIGQERIAGLLPLVALGLPARAYRAVEVRASTGLFRLVVSASALGCALVAWAAGMGPAGMALAFASREWVGTALMRLWPSPERLAERPVTEPLTLWEAARETVVTSRRLLTYRLTKNLLTVFGPFGNLAARTGRGLGWHARLEPYMPHRFAGFVLFALVTGGIAVFLAARSGEPAAMIAAAGLGQLCAIALNVLVLWRFLPDRNDPDLVVEDDDDE
jgi:hypothetical protein